MIHYLREDLLKDLLEVDWQIWDPREGRDIEDGSSG